MRDYAITHPQLLNQAAALGFSDGERGRIHEAYGLAVGLVDGIYRKNGVPFLCHLVRTSSIVMTETRSVDVVLAAMLHAAYFLHYFQASGRRGPRTGDRRFLRETIGEHAEMLVDRYAGFAWNEPGVMRAYAENAAQLSNEVREILLIELANELEENLDAAPAYLAATESGARHARFGDEYVAVAEALGHRALASDLLEAFARCRATEVPASMRQTRSGSYELRSRLWKANPIERLGSALRRRRSPR